MLLPKNAILLALFLEAQQVLAEFEVPDELKLGEFFTSVFDGMWPVVSFRRRFVDEESLYAWLIKQVNDQISDESKSSTRSHVVDTSQNLSSRSYCLRNDGTVTNCDYQIS